MVKIIRYIAHNLDNEDAALRLAEKFDEAVKILSKLQNCVHTRAFGSLSESAAIA